MRPNSVVSCTTNGDTALAVQNVRSQSVKARAPNAVSALHAKVLLGFLRRGFSAREQCALMRALRRSLQWLAAATAETDAAQHQALPPKQRQMGLARRAVVRRNHSRLGKHCWWPRTHNCVCLSEQGLNGQHSQPSSCHTDRRRLNREGINSQHGAASFETFSGTSGARHRVRARESQMHPDSQPPPLRATHSGPKRKV